MAGAVWTNLKDPDDSDLVAVLPKRPHQIAVERLGQAEKYVEEAFPHLEDHESDSTDAYLFGELAFRGEALFECVVPGKNRSTESGGKTISAVVLPWGGG